MEWDSDCERCGKPQNEHFVCSVQVRNNDRYCDEIRTLTLCPTALYEAKGYRENTEAEA